MAAGLDGRARWACLLAALVTAVGCARDEDVAPRWTRLAAGFEPAWEVAEDEAWGPGAQPLRLQPAADLPGVWVEGRLARGAWEQLAPGIWRGPRPLASLRPKEDERTSATLTGDGAPFELLPPRWGSPLRRVEPGNMLAVVERTLRAEVTGPAFCPAGGFVFLVVAPGVEPPEEVVLREYVDPGAPEDGVWRVTVGGVLADGIPVLPGKREALRCDVAPDSALRFATAGLAPSSAGHGEPTVFRVRLDGAVVFEHRAQLGPEVAPAWHVAELPPGEHAGATLSFEVEGPPGLAAFLQPVLGPAHIGERSARPWDGQRPDALLFLADTYRADNLACYGGDLGVAPNLDRFAAQSVRFEARSAASWTYPSHAAMFSGLYPPQCGAGARFTTLSGDARTLAEQLVAAGYRTGAVTESGYVSRSFGLAQGFEWFDESDRPLEQTLAAALAWLDADDGRPSFLFVQSYRAHHPYRVSAATRARLGERLDLSVTWDELQTAELDLEAAQQGTLTSPEIEAWRSSNRALYRGASADLDAGFGGFVEGLRSRGALDEAFVVVTSDHGESFWEHGTTGHGGSVFEPEIRIPLLVRGPGLEPRAAPHTANLIDLPRTIAGLVGVAPAEEWIGADLLRLDRERALLSFQVTTVGPPDRLAIVLGDRKVITAASAEAVGAGRVELAFELDSDPAEASNQAGAPWPGQLLQDLGVDADWLFEPRLGAEAARIDAEQEAQLRALGYL